MDDKGDRDLASSTAHRHDPAIWPTAKRLFPRSASRCSPRDASCNSTISQSDRLRLARLQRRPLWRQDKGQGPALPPSSRGPIGRAGADPIRRADRGEPGDDRVAEAASRSSRTQLSSHPALIDIVAARRPNFMKVAPIISAIDERPKRQPTAPRTG